MRIGIYKPGKKIYFLENTDDHSAISTEVTQIIKIIASRKHEVYILSDSDYPHHLIHNVAYGYHGPMDKLFVWNGVGLTLEDVTKLKSQTDYIYLIVTDLALLPDKSILKLFDDIYTQSPNLYTYGYIQEHECYEFKKREYKHYIKDIEFYFGGTERGRTNDFIEYVINGKALWYGKSDTLGIKNYVPYSEHIELMKRTKYSIVIGDESYNKIGFVTPRYYECIKYGVIAFVDMKYDPDEILIKKDDFRRVRNNEELQTKIQILNNDKDKYQRLLADQRKEITQEKVFGGNIYSTLFP